MTVVLSRRPRRAQRHSLSQRRQYYPLSVTPDRSHLLTEQRLPESMNLDAMGAEYQENLVSAINLRQIFTPDPNNVLLELNFFAD